MPKPTVSVVVPVLEPGKELKPLIRSLDEQDLPYDRYRVVFVDLGSTDGTPERLRELVAYRPNVTVLTEIDRPTAWRSAVEQADTDFVLLLDADDRLHPWALPRLLDHAEEGGLDVVVGRNSGLGPIGFVPESLDAPWQPDGPDAAVALLAPTALIRTALLRQSLATPETGWRTSRVKLLAATSAIGVISEPPLAHGRGPAAGTSLQDAWRDADAAAQQLDGLVRARFIAAHAAASLRRRGKALSAQAGLITDVVRRHVKDVEPSALAPAHRGVVQALLSSDGLSPAIQASRAWESLQLTSTVKTATWSEGAVQLELEVTVSAPDGLDELDPGLLIRNPTTRTSYRLAGAISPVTAEERSRTFLISAELDLRTAAGGQPVPLGNWQPLVRLRGTGSDVPITSRIPAVNLPGAVIDGLPVRPYGERQQLWFDVGAVQHGIFDKLKPTDAAITESAAGSLLTVNLPDLTVSGEASLPGTLYQAKFGLPATLRADPTGARIECYVSGLAGVSRLSARFAPAAKQNLNLQLRIGPTGDFAVEPIKPVAKKSAAAPPPDSGRTETVEGSVYPPPPQKPSPSDSPNLVQRVLPVVKPVGRLLPPSLRKRARRSYRKLIK